MKNYKDLSICVNFATVFGCPFALVVSSNIANEGLVYMLNDMSYDMGIDLGNYLIM